MKIYPFFMSIRPSSAHVLELAYLACPYSDPDPKIRRFRLQVATWVAFERFQQGLLSYSVLTHNIPLNDLGIFGDWQTWKLFDHEMVRRCDKVLVVALPGWDRSKGVAAEVACAKEHGRPVEYYEVPSHILEKASQALIDPELESFTKVLRAFHSERDWDQFHSPKNLVINLAAEMGELAEHFRWVTEDQSYNLPEDAKRSVVEEIGDVMISLLNLCDKLNINPLEAAHQKLQLTAQRYPIEKSKGSCQKYSAYAPKNG